MELTLLTEIYAIGKMDAETPLPDWIPTDDFVSVTRTADEFSIVCKQTAMPGNVCRETGWRVLKVAGPLDFAQTGILASLAVPLAEAEIPIFAVSTFETDYLLLKEMDLPAARTALQNAGHTVQADDTEGNP